MAEKIYYWFLLVLALIALGVSIAGYIGSVKHRDAFATVCSAKGGVVVLGDSKLLCVRASSIIPIE